MKTLLRILPVLALFVAIARGQDAPFPGNGLVKMESVPPGAEVYAGDSLLGVTPIQIAKSLLDSVSAYYPTRQAWNAERQTVAQDAISADQGVVLLRFVVHAMVNSIPPRAAVYRGDSLLGFTPLAIALPDSGLSLTLKAAGYKILPVKLTREGELHSLFYLDPLNGGSPPATYRSRPASRGVPKLNIIASGAVSVAAGIAAVLMKQTADNKYDDYLNSGNESFRKDAHRYDIYSGIALAVMDISLGYLVYILLDRL